MRNKRRNKCQIKDDEKSFSSPQKHTKASKKKTDRQEEGQANLFYPILMLHTEEYINLINHL